MSNLNLRQTFRQLRKQISIEQQQQAGSQVFATSLKHTALAQANTIACYLANDGEVDPRAMIEYCWQHQKRVLLPVLHPFCKGHLVFVDYHPNSPMHTNCYGISEPIATSQNICPIHDIDIIFTPLVAFDATGNRLGMGGGYYDRTLAPIRRDNLQTQIIGLAHTCQQAQSLPNNSWDIPLHGIATPQHFFNTN